MQTTLQQVTQLSDGTIATCIRQYQSSMNLFKGFDSNDYEVINTVRGELKSLVSHNNKHSTWIDVFNALAKYEHLRIGGALFAYCLDSVTKHQLLPRCFKVRIFDIECNYEASEFGEFLTLKQKIELEKLSNLQANVA